MLLGNLMTGHSGAPGRGSAACSKCPRGAVFPGGVQAVDRGVVTMGTDQSGRVESYKCGCRSVTRGAYMWEGCRAVGRGADLSLGVQKRR